MQTILSDEFIEAARMGNISIIEQYIQNGYDVNIQDEIGFTALIFAARHRRKEIVELLLDAGANVNIKNAFGDTALIEALDDNIKEIVEMLENYPLYKLRKKLNIDNNKTLKNSNIF